MSAESRSSTLVRSLHIPIRPKCVQSTRFARGHTFVSPDVRQWKKDVLLTIRPLAPSRPANGPVRILGLSYNFALPTTPGNTSLFLCEIMRQQGYSIDSKTKKGRLLQLVLLALRRVAIPYLAKADLMDNLNKGLMDCLTGLYWIDDSQIWQNCGSRKVYSTSNSINISMELTYE